MKNISVGPGLSQALYTDFVLYMSLELIRLKILYLENKVTKFSTGLPNSCKLKLTGSLEFDSRLMS